MGRIFEVKLTSINVREENEGRFVERKQGIQHQPIDLNGVFDVSSNWVLQSHNVVMVLHLVTLNTNENKDKHLSSPTRIKEWLHGGIPSQLFMIST